MDQKVQQLLSLVDRGILEWDFVIHIVPWEERAFFFF